MAHILKNKSLEVHIDLPLENYNFSRFDWTGKIVDVKFQNIQLSAFERPECANEHHFGKGFYNEFGIDTALGFAETEIGGWFHKIGVGLLKKEDDQYLFHKKYEIKPANFETFIEINKMEIHCISDKSNGYSYVLKKRIELDENSFTINYKLLNTGDKDIITSEYAHCFTAINKEPLGTNYILRFPFRINPEEFAETVNPEGKVVIGQNEITFRDSPNEQFFFSKLSGNKQVDANWELISLSNKLGVSETGSFQTNKVNLWGWKHVISPELFINIAVKPGQSASWSRTYKIYKLNR